MKTAMKHLALPYPFVASSGSMGIDGRGWNPIQRILFQNLVPTTKTVSLDKRIGNRFLDAYRPLFLEKSCVNAMSLGNPGIKHLINTVIPNLAKPSILSLYAQNADECREMCNLLQTAVYNNPLAIAVEMNLSCPNVKGIDSENFISILEVAASLPLPIVAKIGHQQEYLDLALYAAENGIINGISGINSVPWADIYPKRVKSPLESSCGQQGGVSGRKILQLALDTVLYLRSCLAECGMPDFPLIAGGGISSKHEIEKFNQAGATYYSIGSALTMPHLWPQLLCSLR